MTLSAHESTPTLAERRNDLTQRLILDAAMQMLEQLGVGELTVRVVAKQARISERTVFRYFATRDEFLDAVAAEVRNRLDLPPPPKTLQEIEAAPRTLYAAFEARQRLTLAALHPEIFGRMREAQARERWDAVRTLVDQLAPERPERQRRMTAANIRYYLSASTWHYYRFYFGFTLNDTIACADMAIRQALDELLGRCDR